MHVSKSALLRRVNRRLAKDGEVVRIHRTGGYERGLSWQPGDMYRIDANRMLLDANVDLEALAREIGAILPSEQLADAVA